MAEEHLQNNARPQALPKRLALETAQMVRFFSRLPVPALPFERDPHAAPDFRTAVRMLPVASVAITLPAVLLLIAADVLGAPASVAVLLAVALNAIITGALHEDGLADCCDALGGRTVEARLAILKDSRLGTYGVLALLIGVSLRLACLHALLSQSTALGAAALLSGAVVSRAAAIWIMHALPPARPDGAAASVGRPSRASVLTGSALGVLIGGAALALAHGLAGLPMAMALAALATLASLRLARRLLGGQTGDVIGAAQQAAEIAFLMGLTMSLTQRD